MPANDPGAAGQHHRYLPDVSLAAAGHEGYLVFHEGGLYMVGGTSASSPAFAGLMAIVDQFTGGRNGNPNTRFYSLAAQAPAAWHDVTTGTIAVPCAAGSPGCSTSAQSGAVGVMNGYAATQYYDLATGLVRGRLRDGFQLGRAAGRRSRDRLAQPEPDDRVQRHPDADHHRQRFPGERESHRGLSRVQHEPSGDQRQRHPDSGSDQHRATARYWSITVANPTGPASSAASLNVVVQPAGPVVSSVTPNPLTGANTGQVITINGSAFVSGTALKVVVGYPGFSATLAGQQVAFVNSTQILALVNVGVTARSWTVQVVNPNGLASNNGSLQVVAPPPPPVIASLTPNPMARSTSAQTLTINGSGFQSGSGLHVVLSSTGSPTASQATFITSVSATQIHVTVNAGNMARVWTVQVVNPNGAVSNPATLTVK